MGLGWGTIYFPEHVVSLVSYTQFKMFVMKMIFMANSDKLFNLFYPVPAFPLQLLKT